ncbi:hypothetical protein ONS95_006498 [Cadophora gregata]|uniref:uncharacterized protein n=1 Tax=Cadophora gregata TaxID=51156 RepID=UPI0026DD1423|nr:uncharacterized protein ONS95_006498 [Cadophora gregata]KAK0101322.1 hypothetical protein ONS95_006498 [Cadophora gregata]KAK0106667.1 hypothetical protein ONS96_004287 [Cadophora gregata f. sp. sojae]
MENTTTSMPVVFEDSPSSISPSSFECTNHQYTTEILSLEPPMIYLNNFITLEESRYLIKLGTDHYNGFRVTGEKDVKDGIAPPSADLPKTDPVVSCVGQRALKFLGFMGLEDYEPPWLVKYGTSQMLRIHHDPSPIEEPMVDENGRRFHRWATLFIYLENDCLGGETLFPNLPAVPPGANKTKFATTRSGYGMAMRPLEGSGAFWVNFHPNGTRNGYVAHGGLPIVDGYKYALNIFAKKWAD